MERLKWLNRDRYKFHDTTIGANVRCALHAMAIDEKRGPFAPTLWQTPVPDERQIVEQVWFSGVHSNVGGGYDDSRLSDLALDWMIRRVRKHTHLKFEEGYIRECIHGDPEGTEYESRTALYLVSRVLPYQRVLGGQDRWVRRIFRRANAPDRGETFVNEAIHQSALERYGKTVIVQQGTARRKEIYQPGNLDAARESLPVVGYDGKIVGTL